MARIRHFHGEVASILACLVAITLLLGASLLPTPASALELQVNDVTTGADLSDFSYLVNVDNTAQAFDPDPNKHPGVDPMASYSPIVAAGDELTTTIVGADGLPLPPDRYLISVRAPGYKLWGAHVDTRPAGGGDAQTVVVELLADQVETFPGSGLFKPTAASLVVKVFPDFAPVNGFPDFPFEVCESPAACEAPIPDMSGFHIVIKDPIGEVTVNHYGDPICGTGICLTDSDGNLTIENLGPGKYETFAIPPTGSGWIQTTTFEGTRAVDAWLEEATDGHGAPREILREPFVLTAHFFGFSQAMNAPGGPGTITGTVRSFTAWPPAEQLTLYQPVNRPWITLTDIGATDQQILRARGNADGTFSISGVPVGTYQMAIWDDPLDYIMAFYTVTVPEGGGTVAMGNIGMFRWFAWLSGFVFNDVNGDGIKQASELGISNMDLDVRFRDGSLDKVTFTNSTGRYEFPEVRSPLGRFQIAEVGFPRLARTGKSVHNEQFSNSLPPTVPDSVQVVPGDLGGDLLVNQLLIEGNRTIIDWGKRVYSGTDNGGIAGIVYYATTRNEFDARLAAAEDYEPGVPNVLMRLWQSGTDLVANTADDVLLNELSTDAWEHPSVANGNGCTVQDRNGNDLATPGSTPEFVADNCIEVPMNRNETKDGAFDGGYQFEERCVITIDVDSGPGTLMMPVVAGPNSDGGPLTLTRDQDVDLDGIPNHRDVESLQANPDVVVNTCTSPLTPTTYVTQVVPPPFYQIVAEEDQNTDEGSDIIPLIPPPPCVGDLHEVDDARNPFDGQDMPYCNKRLVTLQARQNPAADFFLFTDMDADPNSKLWSGDKLAFSDPNRTDAVPPPGRFFGLVEDDLNLNTDPNSITFGEKRSVPGIPILVRDYTFRTLTKVNTDENGYYEVLLPSTYTALCPVPGGICPGMYILTVNDPNPDPVTGFPDPNYRSMYLTEPAVRDAWPGKMTPTDTPIDPLETGASCTPSVATGLGAEENEIIPTPEIMQVSVPYGTALSPLSIEIKGVDFGPGATPPSATLTDASGTVTPASGSTYFPGTPGVQSEDTLDVTFPGLPAGIYQLLVKNNASGRTTVSGLSIHLLGTGYNPPLVLVSPPTDLTDTPIQNAIDAGSTMPGSLIVVAPGTYRENVILHKAVMLQGHGPGGAVGAPESEVVGVPPIGAGEDPFSHIPGSVIDGRYYTFDLARQTAWAGTLAGPASPYGGPASVDAGAVITVVAQDGEFTASIPGVPGFKPRIDGFGIGFGRGLAGGGIYIHHFGRNLQITNNIFDANSSAHGGALSIGEPVAEGGVFDDNPADSINDGVGIFHNRIVANGGVRSAGAVGIFSGANNYEIAFNDFCGNASSEYGGAISHFGLSPGGSIHNNRIYYNDAFDEGGGVLIGGDQVDNTTVPGVDNLGYGSGDVVIDANLIQRNKSNDDGGGIMLLRPLDSAVDITNNLIINNVATDFGGGLALDDASNLTIVNNTIALNISTSTAEDRDITTCGPTPGPLGTPSCPHAAGLISTNHSAPFVAYLGTGPGFSNPVLFNNIFWNNEAFFFDPNTPQGPPGTEMPGLFTAGFIDLEVIGTPGTLNPQFSLLTVAYAGGANNLVGQDPLFVEEAPHGVEAGPSRLNPNEISVDFLRITPLDGDYHLQTTPVASPAINAGTSGPIAMVTPPGHDFDNDIRPFGSAFDIGADETGVSEPPPPPAAIALLYFSTVNPFNVPGTAPGTADDDDADIYQYNSDGTFVRVFDASVPPASLPATADIDALKMVDTNTFYVSFLAPITLPTVGLVDDSDIVLYDNGTWSMYFDGSDVGLTGDGEDVDAFEILPGGTSIVVSTLGAVDVPVLTGESQVDLLRCDASLGGFGSTTNCAWTMYFDASDVGLTAAAGENIDGVSILSVGGSTKITLSTTGNFSVPNSGLPNPLTGADEDVFVCNGATTGAATACANFSMFFDGSAHGITDDIDAFETAVDPATVTTALAPATLRVAGQ